MDIGFEDHPVTYVSWYGATAFATHYGWRLPTEWGWESVANYIDNRIYATCNSLYDSKRFFTNYGANGYDGREPNDLPYHSYVEHGTTPVGYFGYYGYGLADMAGNVEEWTSTVIDGFPFFRGGSWLSFDGHISVSSRFRCRPVRQCYLIGFRVCR